jgi:hypothetical protein
MNVDILKCELARIIVLYAQRLAYGIECDLEALLILARRLRNQIAILESNCQVNSQVLTEIRKTINKIQKNTSINFCFTC